MPVPRIGTRIAEAVVQDWMSKPGDRIITALSSLGDAHVIGMRATRTEAEALARSASRVREYGYHERSEPFYLNTWTKLASFAEPLAVRQVTDGYQVLGTVGMRARTTTPAWVISDTPQDLASLAGASLTRTDPATVSIVDRFGMVTFGSDGTGRYEHIPRSLQQRVADAVLSRSRKWDLNTEANAVIARDELSRVSKVLSEQIGVQKAG